MTLALAPAIWARDGSKDPDSLFGCLLFLEAGGDIKRLAKLAKSRVIAGFVQKARDGHAGRVEAFLGDEYRKGLLDFPDGLFAVRWQREVLAMLLRADGATTKDLELLLVPYGSWVAGKAILQLRAELKAFSIKIDGDRVEGRNDFRYRITGTSAWRLQKIIANGWSL